MKIVQGDLIEMASQGVFDLIFHGCNCMCVMGSGIAKQVRSDIPTAWKADQATVAGDRSKLGGYTESVVGDLIVLNAYTQYSMNRETNDDHFEYDAFKTFLSRLDMDFDPCKVGLPMIGMGRAGGDKIRIMAILEDWARDTPHDVTMVEYVV